MPSRDDEYIEQSNLRKMLYPVDAQFSRCGCVHAVDGALLFECTPHLNNRLRPSPDWLGSDHAKP